VGSWPKAYAADDDQKKQEASMADGAGAVADPFHDVDMVLLEHLDKILLSKGS
jgi:hypothetical protein